MRRASLLLFFPASAALALGALQDPARTIAIEPGFHHLGDDRTPEWPEAPEAPSTAPLELTFQAEANPRPWTLRWRQRHVDSAWQVLLNGLPLGSLPTGADLGRHHLAVPAQSVRDGANVLRVEGGNPSDDFTIGELELLPRPFHEVLGLGRLQVEVRSADGGLTPCRLTLTQAPAPAPTLHAEPSAPFVPLRPGIAYTDQGRADFWLPAGPTSVYASRGVEWSRALEQVEVVEGETARVSLVLERQFQTDGFVAADTHIHTLTFSGHGDSSLDERLHTLAGEGVELAIATDHNHQTDYGPRQRQLGLSDWFTPVIGNEVTTENGHFNAFPFQAEAALPNHRLPKWADLVTEMRSKGARVVILNHPRWPVGDSPFDLAGLHAGSGGARRALELEMDAFELFNSTTPEVHPEVLLQDWFGLLNAGYRLTAVGSSDSHTVGDSVGQGRSYVRSEAAASSAIDVDAACDSFLEGAVSCSLGLFADLLVNGRSAMGSERVQPVDGFAFQLRVAAPHWARAETASVYRNGRLVEERRLPPPGEGPTDLLLDFRLPPIAGDSWVVCVVRGPKVEEPFWSTKMPYSAAVTNPVWLDDGDGAWRSVRAEVEAWLEADSIDASHLRSLLGAARAEHLEQAGLLLLRRHPAIFDSLRDAAGPHRPVFQRLHEHFRPVTQ